MGSRNIHASRDARHLIARAAFAVAHIAYEAGRLSGCLPARCRRWALLASGRVQDTCLAWGALTDPAPPEPAAAELLSELARSLDVTPRLRARCRQRLAGLR